MLRKAIEIVAGENQEYINEGVGDMAGIVAKRPVRDEHEVASEIVPITLISNVGPEDWDLHVLEGTDISSGLLPSGRILIGDIDRPDAVLSWSTQYNKPFVHNIWVAEDMRNRGVARILYDAFRRHVSDHVVSVGPWSPGGYETSKVLSDEVLLEPPEQWQSKKGRLHKAIQLVADLTDLDSLKSYLTLSDADKGRDLAANFGQDFLEYLESAGEEELAAAAQAEIEKNEFLDWPFLEGLPDKVFVEFLQNLPAGILEDPNSPTYLTVDFERDVEDEWLIHGTNNASDIESGGFTRGVWDYTTLSLTTHFVDSVKTGGFNFAFYADKFHESDVLAYGKEAVVFQASGIETWHHGDQQRQIIFLGSTAHDIHAIQRSSYGDFYASLGEEEFVGSLQECANWIMERA